MTRISYVSTSFYKWVVPSLALLVLLSLAGAAAMVALQGRWAETQELVYGSLIAAVGVVLVWRYCFTTLCDEVWDDGEQLIVRNRGTECVIPLANIVKVRYRGVSNPAWLTLELDPASELGGVVRFLLPYRYWPLSEPRIYVELRERCAAARAGATFAKS